MNIASSKFKPSIAGHTIVDGLEYLKNRLEWSDAKVATILHLSVDIVNIWLKNKKVPISSSILQSDIQSIVHLLAIHRSLEAMFENPAQQRAWLSTFHPDLNVIPEILMGESIDGLIFIRQYLDFVYRKGA